MNYINIPSMICMLIVWVLLGIISLLICYEYDIVENPIWKPFIILFGVVSLFITLIVVVIRIIKQWVNEVKKYYRARK